eukprot:gene24033-9610_t
MAPLDSGSRTNSSTVLFIGGVAIGSAFAFGAAYGLAQYYGIPKDASPRRAKAPPRTAARGEASQTRYKRSGENRGIMESQHRNLTDAHAEPRGRRQQGVKHGQVGPPLEPRKSPLSFTHGNHAASHIPAAAHKSAVNGHAANHMHAAEPPRPREVAPYPPSRSSKDIFPPKTGSPTPGLTGNDIQALAALHQEIASHQPLSVQQHMMLLNNFGGEASKGMELGALHGNDYCRVITPEASMTEEVEEVCALIVETMELRNKWLFQGTPPLNCVHSHVFAVEAHSRSLLTSLLPGAHRDLDLSISL